MNKSMFTKLFALVLMVCVVFSLAIVVSSAEATPQLVATFELGADKATTKHGDGSEVTSYTEEDGDYTLEITNGVKMYTGANDATGKSCIKFGTGTSSVIGSMKFTVPDDVVTVKIYVAKYKAKNTKVTVNGTTTTLTKSSDNGAYDVITVDTSTTKTVSFTTVASSQRAMLNTIEFYAKANEDCDHINQTTTTNEATCTTAGSTIVTCDDCNSTLSSTPIPATGHVNTTVTETIDATCTENGSITKTCACSAKLKEVVPAFGHNYDNKVCTVCGEKSPANVVLTVNSLGVPNNSYSNGVCAVDGTAFQYVEIGNYNNGIQVRVSTNASTIWNTSAFGAGIKKIVLVYNSEKDTYDNTDCDIFTFGNEMGEVAYTTKLSTTTTSKTYEIIPDKDTYTFFKYQHDFDKSGYWDSMTIVLEDEEPEAPKFNDASVILGKDLGMIYNVTSPAGEPTMTVEFADKTVDLVAEKLENGTYNFTFKGIGPHQMAENIKATLKVNGEVVAEFDDYSVEKNLKNIKNNDANLTDLVNATLVYGAQAEAYKGIEKGVDLTGIEVNNAAIADDANALECKNGADCAFTAAGVNFDSANRIYVKFKVTGNFNFYVNGTVVELEKSEDGSYKFYTDALTAKQFDDKFTFVIETEDSMATLVYSVNSYAYAMQNDVEMANLVKALYAYGAAAEKYTA